MRLWHVAVLLSTKNGARFIVQQVESIMAQTYHKKRLFWRDDGSSDATPNIIEKYFKIKPYDTCALGITNSYASLLQRACDDDYEFFAFADQDDVWATDKLDRGIAHLYQVPSGQPALYCARQTLVDVNLNQIGSSARFRQPIGFPAALTQNIAAGCTIMFNRAAADLLRQTLHDQRYHDWWCYLMIAAAGGQIIVDDAEVIQYRQHNNNSIGAPSTYLQRAIGALHRGPRMFMDVFRDHVTTLRQHADLLSPNARADLAVIESALAQGFLAKCKALRLPKFRRQTWFEDVLFRVWFMIG